MYGRHQATTQVVQGAYTAAYSSDNKGTAGADVESAMSAVRDFEENNGRRPRLLVVKMGQDGHDRGAKVTPRAIGELDHCSHPRSKHQPYTLTLILTLILTNPPR